MSPITRVILFYELNQILKQKPARLSAHNVKGYATLIQPSEFDWSEAKLSCYRRKWDSE